MRQHALLAPSAAKRWLACTPSARIAECFPDVETVFAKEGTLAHTLGEAMLRFRTGLISKQKYTRIWNEVQENELYEKEMFEYCRDYANFVLEQQAKLSSDHLTAKMYIEEKLDMSRWVTECFGTGDAGVYNKTTLHIIDLKYGEGVAVSAEKNEQLMLYALGALEMLHKANPNNTIQWVKMTIFQPRLDNIDTYKMHVNDLFDWVEDVVLSKAKQAWDGVGKYVAGEHCRFCPAKETCRTRANFNQGLVDQFDFALPNQLKEHEIAEIVKREKLIVSWLSDVMAYANREALNGRKFPGLKLVEGKSVRFIKDPDKAAAALMINGGEPEQIYKPEQLKTLGDLEKEFGKGNLAAILKGILVKPAGAPALVSENDSRPPIGKMSALNDFKDFINK